MEQLERTERADAVTLVMRTPRLDLVAATVAHLDAELVAPARLGALLGAEVPASWPPGEYDTDAIRFFRERLLAEGPAAVGWYGWYAVYRADAESPATLVAGGGYFGPPDEEGTLEIGYSVAPEWRGRGIARELAAALVARAWATPGVRRVIARTDETNAASMAVLRHCGFRCIGPGAEPGSRRFEHERGAPMAQ